jgi:hypothetical protein
MQLEEPELVDVNLDFPSSEVPGVTDGAVGFS